MRSCYGGGSLADFNPRPPAEGDHIPNGGKRDKRISIHALPRRATTVDTTALMAQTISIHALPRRATMRVYLIVFAQRNFNPRPPAEGDMRLTAV